MTIAALVLYGSCARADNNEKSDVDIFAISSDSSYRMIIDKKINIASYPESLAFERAKNGDLFMWHVVEEGRPIYDTCGIFGKLRKSFRYRDNYSIEISNASDVGTMLCQFATCTSNCTLINRRMAWCVRTILIARSAEQRNPIFSAHKLAKFAESEAVLELISNKNNDHFDGRLLEKFVDFIDEFGIRRSNTTGFSDLDAFRGFFADTDNAIGTKTIALLTNDSADDYSS